MLSRRDFLKLGGSALLAAAFPRLNLSDSPPFSAPIVYHGSRTYRKIAMCFDDCYHAEVIEQLTSMLQPYPDFHFTFFAVGEAIEFDEIKLPGIWKKLIQGGHEIGYHSMHHWGAQVMSTQSLLGDYNEWMATLQGALGFEPRVHFAKPPYNLLSHSWQELCQLRGLVVTQFSTGFEAPNMADSMLLASRVVNGDIVQMHTDQDPANGRFDVEITAQVVPYLAEQGFTLVTMSQLYDDLLVEQKSSPGCILGTGDSLTRTCLEP